MRVIFLFFVCSFWLFANDLSINKGEVLFLELEKKNLQKVIANTSHLKISKNLSILPHPNKQDKVVAILGISYKNPLKNPLITAFYTNKEEKFTLIVKDGTYKKEQLKVDSSKVKPPKAVQERIKKEFEEANKIYQLHTKEVLFKDQFVLPMNSKITSEFGNARMFNDSLASYHSGTDFRAAIGQKVYATNDGIVRLVKDRYYAGGSVIIDHGFGIFSQYYHLSGFKVKVGQRVKRGELIALSGNSGRVTGPHLHFGIFANGTQVNPIKFINDFNALFD